MKRIASLLFLSVLVMSVMCAPMHTNTLIADSEESVISNPLTDNIDSFLPLDKSVRVAIYNEPNTTLPEYASGLGMKFSNEISSLITNLENAGFDVTTLTVHDITDHKLKTADYDVFILADNYPRENITDYVKEFWLGGGGVLSLNAAIGYLIYNGILFPGEIGDDGYGMIWDEETWSDHIIAERHPVTKEYQENDTVNEQAQDEKEFFNGQFIIDNSILGPYTTILANQTSGSEVSSIIAIDNIELGGRIVTMAANTTSISSDIAPIIHDSLEWLCPRPKGRVLFDLTHDAYYGVDPWDDEVIGLSPRYQEWRNILVNHTFLFDKLWPSTEGNLTTQNLEKYDLLITVLPETNFTSSEVTQVTNWVNDGGNLLVLGDKYTFYTQQENINYLMKDYHLGYNTTHSASGTTNDLRLHPVIENLTEILPAAPGIANVQNPAVPVAVTDTGDIIAGAEEFGYGRVVYISDINIFDYARIDEYVNQEFALNIANWLTSSNADILIFSDGGGISFDPDWNYYKSPVARAITNLGLRYHLTHNASYFNLSLNLYQYELIVIDSNYYNIANSYSNEVIDYLEEGGKLAIRSWLMSSDKPLWSYIGIAPNGTTITSGPPDVYLWDTEHPIFTTPNTYGETIISETDQIFGTDYAFIDPLDNATALAGITVNEEEFTAAITINDDETVIANSFSITQYLSDTDSSTYDDGFEIWMNEIAYLLKPTIDHPADLEMEAGTDGPDIVWNPESLNPYEFAIYRDGVEITKGPWSGGPITFITGGPMPYPPDTYLVNCTVWDSAGYTTNDVVEFTVVDTTSPIINGTPDNLEYQEGVTEHLISWSVDELFPDEYELFINGTGQGSDSWIGTDIEVDVGGLSEGIYNLTLVVSDSSGNNDTSTVYLTVTPESTTTTTETTTTTTTTTDTTTTTSEPPPDGVIDPFIIVVVIGGAIIVVIILIVTRRRK